MTERENFWGEGKTPVGQASLRFALAPEMREKTTESLGNSNCR